MNKYIVSVVSGAMLVCMSAAHAETSHTYIGADFYSSLPGYGLRLGYDFNNILAIEGMGISVSSNSQSSNSGSILAGFLRFNLRFEKSTVYGLYGSAQSTTTGSSTSTVATTYGFGADFYATRDIAFTFSSLFQNPTFGVGLTYYFDTPTVSSRY